MVGLPNIDHSHVGGAGRSGYENGSYCQHGAHGSNENKMSDGGRDRASIGAKVWKSSQKWSAQRSAVRSIAWLDDFVASEKALNMLKNIVRYRKCDAILCCAGDYIAPTTTESLCDAIAHSRAVSDLAHPGHTELAD